MSESDRGLPYFSPTALFFTHPEKEKKKYFASPWIIFRVSFSFLYTLLLLLIKNDTLYGVRYDVAAEGGIYCNVGFRAVAHMMEVRGLIIFAVRAHYNFAEGEIMADAEGKSATYCMCCK